MSKLNLHIHEIFYKQHIFEQKSLIEVILVMQELYQSYLDTRWILHLNFCKSTCQISEIFLILDCMSVCKKTKKDMSKNKCYKWFLMNYQ